MGDTAIGIIFDDNRSKVLVIKRRDIGLWVLPGGGVESGESAEGAVSREVREETGVTVEVLRQVAHYTPINRLGGRMHIFECRRLSGTLTTGSETAKVGFFPVDQLPRPFFVVHANSIAEALASLDHPIERPLAETNYWHALCFAIRYPLIALRFLSTKW